jgi:hypothetical protein
MVEHHENERVAAALKSQISGDLREENIIPILDQDCQPRIQKKLFCVLQPVVIQHRKEPQRPVFRRFGCI